MSKLTALQTAKRAAACNPAFKDAKVYITAQDGGAPVYTAAGELQYDAAETTLGYVDKRRETVLTLGPSNVGSHLVTVLSEVAPNGVAQIFLDGCSIRSTAFTLPTCRAPRSPMIARPSAPPTPR